MYLSVRVSAQGASAENAYIVYGLPAPSTYLGFAHALTRNLGFGKQELPVLPIVHRFRFRAGRRFGSEVFDQLRSAERDTPKGKGSPSKTQSDIPRLDLEIGIIIPLPEGSAVSVEQVQEAMVRLRFGGGTLTGEPRVAISSTLEEACRILGPGFVMQEGPEITSGTEGDALDTLLNLLTHREPGMGWLAPSLIGYRLLEDPVERQGARKGYSHVFADPLIGVVRYVSSKSARIEDFWRTVWEEPRRIMYRSGRPDETEIAA